MRKLVALVRWNASRNRTPWYEEFEEEIEEVEERNKKKEEAERKTAERELVKKVFESILNLGSLKPIVESPQISEAEKLVFLEETLKEKRLVYFRQICPKTLHHALKTYQNNPKNSSNPLQIQQEEVAIEKKARFYRRSGDCIEKPRYRVWGDIVLQQEGRKNIQF